MPAPYKLYRCQLIFAAFFIAGNLPQFAYSLAPGRSLPFLRHYDAHWRMKRASPPKPPRRKRTWPRRCRRSDEADASDDDNVNGKTELTTQPWEWVLRPGKLRLPKTLSLETLGAMWKQRAAERALTKSVLHVVSAIAGVELEGESRGSSAISRTTTNATTDDDNDNNTTSVKLNMLETLLYVKVNHNDNNNNNQSERSVLDIWKESWKEEMTENNLQDFGDHIWRYLLGDWSTIRENHVALAVLRALCVVVLSWAVMEEMVTSISVTALWLWTCLFQTTTAMTTITASSGTAAAATTATSFTAFQYGRAVLDFLTHPSQRQALLQSYGFLRIRLDSIFVVVNGVGTLLLLPFFENLVCTIDDLCFSIEYRERYPIIHRIQSMVFSFLLAILGIKVVSSTGIVVGALLGFGKQWVVSHLCLFR